MPLPGSSRRIPMKTLDSPFLDKKLISFAALIFIASAILRYFAFAHYGGFSNDDSAYVGMARSMFSGGGIAIDGVPHTLFPPGYSFFLGIENIFLGSFLLAKRFEYVILMGIFSFLSVLLSIKVGVKMRYTATAIFFLSPVFILGAATLGLASEIWFSVMATSGLILTVHFYNSGRNLHLLASSFLYAIAFLIRPEGLAFYSSSVVAVALSLARMSKNECAEKVWSTLVKCAIAIMAPLSITVLPYAVFLYSNLGFLTISGKDKFNADIAASAYQSLYQQLVANGISLLKILFFSPLFMGPAFALLLILGLACSVVKLKSCAFGPVTQKALIVISPVPFIFAALLRYLPWARAVFPLVPALTIVALLLIQDHPAISKLLGRKGDRNVCILSILISLVIVSSSVTAGKFSDNPKSYYRLADAMQLGSYEGFVYSRNNTLMQYMPSLKTCSDLDSCPGTAGYALISNSVHNSLSALNSWEKLAAEHESLSINGASCNKEAVVRTGTHVFLGFRCQ